MFDKPKETPEDIKKSFAAIEKALSVMDIDFLISFFAHSVARTAEINKKQDPDYKSLFDAKSKIDSKESFTKKLEIFIKKILKCGSPLLKDLPKQKEFLEGKESPIVEIFKDYLLNTLANLQHCVAVGDLKLTYANANNIILAAFLVTNKFIFDDRHKNPNKNEFFATAGEISIQDMALFEKEFFKAIQHELIIDPKIIEKIASANDEWFTDDTNEELLLKFAGKQDQPKRTPGK